MSKGCLANFTDAGEEKKKALKRRREKEKRSHMHRSSVSLWSILKLKTNKKTQRVTQKLL